MGAASQASRALIAVESLLRAPTRNRFQILAGLTYFREKGIIFNLKGRPLVNGAEASEMHGQLEEAGVSMLSLSLVARCVARLRREDPKLSGTLELTEFRRLPEITLEKVRAKLLLPAKASDLCRAARAAEDRKDYNEVIKLRIMRADIFRILEDKHSQALELSRTGRITVKIGHSLRGGEYFLEAARLFGDALDIESQAVNLSYAGRALIEADQIDRGVDARIRAAQLFGKLGRKKEQADELSFAGKALIKSGKLIEGIDLSKQAACLYQEIEDFESLGWQLFRVGKTNIECGEVKNGIDLLLRAVDAFLEDQSIKLAKEAASTLSSLGSILASLGKTDEAIEMKLQAAEIFRLLEDEVNEAFELSRVGEALMEAREIHLEIVYELRAAALFGKTRRYFERAVNLNSAGYASIKAGKISEGAELLLEADDAYCKVEVRDNKSKRNRLKRLSHAEAAVFAADPKEKSLIEFRRRVLALQTNRPTTL